MTNATAAHRATSPGRGQPRSGAWTQPPSDVILIGHTGQVGSAVARRLGDLRDGEGRGLVTLKESINRRSHTIHGDDRDRTVSHRTEILESLAERVGQGSTLVVDCSADPELPDHYPAWLRAGIGVITPNKHGLAGGRERYDRIRRAARQGRAPLAYSATVGAGLPAIAQLRRLRASGVTPDGIEAVLSGTLVQVFGAMQAGATLSESVARAQHAGFTEPDPLQDLSGEDVARKLRILLREAGLPDRPIHREPVIDDDWARAARASGDVLGALREFDACWAIRLAAARRENKCWVYLARFNGEQAQVGPVAVPATDDVARLQGSDNRVEISAGPARWTIGGPGAGIDVTATAVLADLAEAALRQQETRGCGRSQGSPGS